MSTFRIILVVGIALQCASSFPAKSGDDPLFREYNAWNKQLFKDMGIQGSKKTTHGHAKAHPHQNPVQKPVKPNPVVTGAAQPVQHRAQPPVQKTVPLPAQPTLAPTAPPNVPAVQQTAAPAVESLAQPAAQDNPTAAINPPAIDSPAPPPASVPEKTSGAPAVGKIDGQGELSSNQLNEPIAQPVAAIPSSDGDLPVANYFDDLCGAGWIGIRGTNKCIKVFNKPANFKNAEQECYKLDPCSSLLTIHSEQENKVLTGLVKQSTQMTLASKVWIGLTGKNQPSLFRTEPVYSWMDNSTLAYTNWKSVMGIHHHGDCVVMSLENDPDKNGKWCQQDCNKEKPFVCQKLTRRGFFESLKPCPVKVFADVKTPQANEHGQSSKQYF